MIGKGAAKQRGGRGGRVLPPMPRAAFVFLDKTLAVRDFTPGAGKAFGFVAGDRGRGLGDLARRFQGADVVGDVREAMARGRPVERRVTSAQGRAHAMHVIPYREPDTRRRAALLAFIDVASISEAEEELKIVAAELSHRMKNTLAVVASMANQTMRHATSLEQFSKTFLGRLLALAATHDLLSQSEWTQAGLRELIDAELRPHLEPKSARVMLRGSPVSLKPRAVLTLGIVLHELAANAVKFGALAAPRGRLAVTWGTRGAGANRRLELTWRETGGPPVSTTPVKRGFGWELIERGVAFELDGEAKIDLRPEGLCCRISLPLGRHASAANAREREGRDSPRWRSKPSQRATR